MSGTTLQPNDFRAHLVIRAKDLERRCAWARDAHFYAARRWEGVNMWVGLAAAVVGVAGGGSAGILNAGPAAAVAATIAGLLAAVSAFLKAGDHVDSHKRAGDGWTVLREQAATLYDVDAEFPTRTDDDLLKEYNDLLKSKEQTTLNSPIIPSWAYAKAYNVPYSATLKRGTE